MTITVKYSDGSELKFKTFETITNNELVVEINCSGNQLTHLPENLNFPMLGKFDCSDNKITYLPENMNFQCSNF